MTSRLIQILSNPHQVGQIQHLICVVMRFSATSDLDEVAIVGLEPSALGGGISNISFVLL